MLKNTFKGVYVEWRQHFREAAAVPATSPDSSPSPRTKDGQVRGCVPRYSGALGREALNAARVVEPGIP